MEDRELICYLNPGWEPRLQPAPATRPWMDATQDAYAYRCLPMNIANAHGWEILSPCSFDTMWDGSTGIEAVSIRTGDVAPHCRPVSIFGHGVLTFHINGLFRTPPGWSLWVGGSPNRPKDAVYPLSGVVETDWAPYTFTMNWKFTRRNHWIRFVENEPICFVFPVQRAALPSFRPSIVPMAQSPETARQFAAWSASRNEFHATTHKRVGCPTAATWQKHYYRGLDMDERPGTPDHMAKLRLRPFIGGRDKDGDE